MGNGLLERAKRLISRIKNFSLMTAPEVVKPKFDHATVMLMPPPYIAARALLYGRAIPDDDLADHGRETTPHITIKYGLDSDKRLIAQRIVDLWDDVQLTFGRVELFRNDEHDVVVVKVDSPQLRSMHRVLSALPNKEEERPYNPHLTIAYVKKGRGERYIGQSPLGNETMTIAPNIVFSNKHGEQTRIKEQLSDLYDTAIAQGAAFTVFKQANGEYRWVSLSSNAYRDRDGEIVSTKALSDDVARADATGDYGPLRLWHVPGADIGNCDFNMMIGRFLVESGTFDSPQIAVKMAQAAPNLRLSIGFRHPPGEPDSEGIFWNIRRFERSALPAGREANPFTSLSVVTKESGMTQDQKLAHFKSLLGDDLYGKVVDKVVTSEKSADSMGIAFKEAGVNLDEMTPDELLEYAVKQYEAHEEAEATKMHDDDKKKGDDADDDEEKTPAWAQKMNGRMAAIEKKMAEMDKPASSTKEATEIARLNSMIADQQAVIMGLKEAYESEPAAFQNGNRPSQSESTVKEGAEIIDESATKELGELGGLVDFLVMPNGATG